MIAPRTRVRDPSQVWYERLLKNHLTEALDKVAELLDDTEMD